MKKNDILKSVFNRKRHGSQTPKAVVLLSGGIDSTVVLYWAKFRGLETVALEFSYDGRPAVEAERNKQICAKVGIALYSIDYPRVKSATPSVTNDNSVAITESNSVYYILAGNFAQTIGAQHILGGQILPDWKDSNIRQAAPDFYDRLNQLLKMEHGDTAPLISMPLLYKSKDAVVRMGKKLGVPFELTWTCPNSSQAACNACTQCKERSGAFKKAGLNEDGVPPAHSSRALKPGQQ